MGRFHYRHSGILVSSELALPEWHAFAVEGDEMGEPDAVIRFDEVLEQGSPPDHAPVVDGDALRFTSKGVGTWRVRGGTEIAIHPLGDPNSIEVRLFTLGSAWGTLGYQRGWAMLHGSAVAGPEGAALFCGPQEAGKSTMAAGMVRQGYSLVGDDLSRVVPGRADRASELYPSSTRHKLWQEAIDALALSERDKVQDYFRADKYLLETDRSVLVGHPVPLGRIYMLEFGDSFKIEPVSGADAAKALLKETAYRPRFLEAMGKLPEQAVYAAQIAATADVYRLIRPRDLAQLDEVCERVTDHWAMD